MPTRRKRTKHLFPPLPPLPPPPSSLKVYSVAIFAHGKLFWLFPNGNRMLPCLHILCTTAGSEGITEGMKNGETATATEYQSPDLGATRRPESGKVSKETRKRVHQKGEEVHLSRPQSHRRFLSPDSIQ